jgi:hypothetical protein
MTNPDDTAHTWRDLTDQLTDGQNRALGRIETDLLQRGAPPAEIADTLLEHARDHANHNLHDAAHFGHLPDPAGAQFVEHFEDDGHGGWSRRFDGTVRAVDDVHVQVVGAQHTDGRIERSVHVHANGVELTGGQARELAAALTEAADELDRLQ